MEAGVICILLSYLGAFSFGELKTLFYLTMYDMYVTLTLSDLELIEGNCG